MAILPTIMTAQGPVPRSPADIRAALIANVAATNPGYTANLPGSLIEDIASTDIAAISLMEQAKNDLISSLSPYGANDFLLTQLGNVYGQTLGTPNNTAVYVQFTGNAGYVIPIGLTVTDGSYQYAVKDGGILDSTGNALLYCVATSSGSWAVPANTVTTFITSIPSTMPLSCTNPQAGIPGSGTESPESFRARVLQSGIATTPGALSYLKTLIMAVSGVQQRLVSVQPSAGSFKVIVGGGDPYQVAFAIFQGLFDINDLTGSSTTARNIVTTITDYPDNYQITFVNPPLQEVGMTVTWNTYAPNFTGDAAVAQLAIPAIIQYINSLPVGYDINIMELNGIFLSAVNAVIPQQYISHLAFALSINNISTPPLTGTNLVQGDSEGYFLTDASRIVFARG